MRTWIVLIGISLLLAGCAPGRPTTYSASGSVTYKGKPVDGAQVMFVSPDGRSATATTDQAGEFTLNTFEEGDGVLPGTHQVSITKHIAQPTSPDNPYPQSKNVLPERYARADGSKLTAEVTPDGDNYFPFELTD